MVTAAESFQAGLKYDEKMAEPSILAEYLKKQNNQITPIINGNKLATAQSHDLGGDCKVFYMDIEMKSFPTQSRTWGAFSGDWGKTPLQARTGILHKLGRNLMKHEYLLGMLEKHYRFVPQEEVSDYDLPIIMKFIDAHLEMWSGAEDTDVKLILFEENKASFHFLALSVCKALAQTSGIGVVSTLTSAPLAYLFVSLCLESGVPKNTIQLYIVDGEQLERTPTLFSEGGLYGTLFEEPGEVKSGCCGCSVVVTESADLHSALDSLITGVTFTRCYPWAVSSVFVQESVYTKFQALAEDKLRKAAISESSTFVAPSGSEHLQLLRANGPTLVFGDCRIVDMGSFVTIQPYRTTKELFNLVKYPARFALSVWCDSVSVANEISTAADVSIVWINMYGVFDLSPQTPVVERHGGMIHELGAEKILYQRDMPLGNGYEEIKKEFIAAVSNLKEKKSKWVKCSTKEKVSKILESIKSIPEGHLTAEEIINMTMMIEKLNSEYRIANSNVRIINGKMNIRILKPVGTVFIHDVLDTKVLTDAVVSVLEGNSVLYVGDDRPNLSNEVLKHLSKAEDIPVVALELDYNNSFEGIQVAYATKMFDAIVRNGYYKFYEVKNIWSPIGESFAN